MKLTLCLLIALVAVLGCDPKPQAEPAPENPSTGTTAQSPDAGAGGVTPMGSMGAGGLTPVAGAESVGGGGSGVGQAAKDKARNVAGSSPSSLNQLSSDGE